MATPGQTIVASALRLSEQVAEPYLKSTAESHACHTDARLVEEAATCTTPLSLTEQLLVSIPDLSLYERERNGNMNENILQMENVRILGRRYGRRLMKLKRNKALHAPFLSWIRQLRLLL